MRTLMSATVLMLATLPAYAQVAPVPEPETLSLLAIGALGILIALRRKK